MAKKLVYTEKYIIKQLQNHYKRNGKITKKSFISDKKACPISRVINKFGTWKKALERADLEMEDGVIYRDEDLLEQLRAHYKKNGKISSSSFSLDKKSCSLSTILLRFGSWNKALEKAELPKNEYSEEEIIRDLQDHYKRYGRITKESFNLDKRVCSSDTVTKYFGSWRKALEYLEYIEPKEYVEYNKEKIFSILKEKVKSGELRRRQDLEKIKGIPSATYITKIWKWTELAEILKIENPLINYTDEMLIEKYKQMEEMEEYKNKKISLNEYSRITKVDPGTISGHFGSWNEFCKIVNNVGWKSTEINYTDEELLELYLEVSKKLGETETGAKVEDIEEELDFVAGVFGIRFGGINNLRRILKLRIENDREPIYTKEEIKKKLLEKYEEYGGILTSRELKELSKKLNKEKKWSFPSYTTILTHFRTTKITEVWDEILEEKEAKESWKKL